MIEMKNSIIVTEVAKKQEGKWLQLSKSSRRRLVPCLYCGGPVNLHMIKLHRITHVHIQVSIKLVISE